jgi:hypothetical protein
MLSLEIVLPLPAALDLAQTGPLAVQAEYTTMARYETNKSAMDWCLIFGNNSE